LGAHRRIVGGIAAAKIPPLKTVWAAGSQREALKRTLTDWLLVAGATAVLFAFGAAALLLLFVFCGTKLWRTTDFH
jgi:hypothetical protein